MEQNRDNGFEEMYMNRAQAAATVVDSNVLIAEIARAGGKTHGIFGPRLTRVAYDMPGELSFLVHRTYVALFSNVVPNLQAYFNTPIEGGRRTILELGRDYIIGEGKVPSFFRPPRYPVAYPKHSIRFSNGHHLQLVSSDQPDSVAGRSGVHAFVEEMKHNKGEKLKSRLFPTLRGSIGKIRESPYYQGITGVSDTARIDLGEDNWFEEYEKNTDTDLVDEIATVFFYVNRFRVELYRIRQQMPQERNPLEVEKLRLSEEKMHRSLALWEPRLREMRSNASFYIRASSFVNKDFLGPKFFKTQMDTLDIEEFLTSICAIRRRQVVNMFFGNYRQSVHRYDDSYKYDSILKMDLKDTFRLTAGYLKYFDPGEKLLLGYDPGHFSSVVVAQERRSANELRVLKEIWCYHPREQSDLARQFNEFFGADLRRREIWLYYDRAGNKRREEAEKITTDARLLKRELEAYGYRVRLMNEGQKTIFYYQHYRLLLMLFGETLKHLPKIRIDGNECKSLCSAILMSPIRVIDGKIELDKTSEVKVPLKYQAGLTTQIPSALMYLLFGHYWQKLPQEMNAHSEPLPDNLCV